MKLPELYSTRYFITVFTQAHNCSLSSASLIEPTAFHRISLRSTLFLFILIPPTQVQLLQAGLPAQGFPTKLLHSFISSPPMRATMCSYVYGM